MSDVNEVVNEVVAGFSLTNRWLIYASVMLAPAQFASGLGSNLPTNLGFLAYNIYNQIVWYWAVKGQQLHALSLVIVHLNMVYALTYLGGITAGNIFMALFLGLGTASLLVLNTISAWTSWATNQTDGFGVYQFYFFGWRTLDDGWHKFIMVWQIGDSIFAFVGVCAAIVLAIWISLIDDDEFSKKRIPLADRLSAPLDALRYPLIPIGAAIMLLFCWPLILWTELIVARNNIESDIDMIAVWLFVAQVGTMLIPSCSIHLPCFRSNK